MASRCSSAIWRVGRLATQSSGAASALQGAGIPQQLSWDGIGRCGSISLLPACAKALPGACGQWRWAQTKVGKKEASKAAATGAQEGNLNAKLQSMLKVRR